jgi:hypothetical protein
MKNSRVIGLLSVFGAFGLFHCGAPDADGTGATTPPASITGTSTAKGVNCDKLVDAVGCANAALTASTSTEEPGSQNTSCSTDADCTQGFGCGRMNSWTPSFEMDGLNAGRMVGLCLEYCTQGDPATCNDGFICAEIFENGVWQTTTGVCTDIATKLEGAACVYDSECQGTLGCLAGVCSRSPEGSLCQIDEDCADGLICYDTAYACGSDTCEDQLCRAIKDGQLGDPCVDDLECNTSLFCQNNVCAELPRRG